MNSYRLFSEIIGKIERLQETLNQLRDLVRTAIEKDASLQAVVEREPVKVSNNAPE